MSRNVKTTIVVDGSCSGNPGPGGWAAILLHGEVEKAISGGAAMTTNNRMEHGRWALKLMEAEPVDVLMVHFIAMDVAKHALWRFMDHSRSLQPC